MGSEMCIRDSRLNMLPAHIEQFDEALGRVCAEFEAIVIWPKRDDGQGALDASTVHESLIEPGGARRKASKIRTTSEISKDVLLGVWQANRFYVAKAAEQLRISEYRFRELLKLHDLKRPWEKASQEPLVTSDPSANLSHY